MFPVVSFVTHGVIAYLLKPKQATKGQKQIDRENYDSLKFYRHVIIAGLVSSLSHLVSCLRLTKPSFKHMMGD